MNKKVAAGVAVTVAVASVATNLAFTPDELTHSAAFLENHTRYIQAGDMGDYDIEYSEPEDLGRKDALRTWLVKLPVPVKAVFLLPLWLLGAVPVAIGTALISALAPVWGQVAGFIMQAALLVGLFCVVYKLVFPKAKIRDLFKKKNRRWLIFGALTLTGVNFGLAQLWPGWSVARVVLMAVAGFGVLCLLWHRVCGRLKAPERRMVKKKLKLEY